MPRVLIIAYHFYPDLEVGAVRSVKFAKYLPAFGWEPYILTVNPRYYRSFDNPGQEFGFPIYRTSKWPTLDDLYLNLKNKIRSNKKPGNDPENGPNYSTISIDEKREYKRPLWKRLLDSLSATPDKNIGWLFPAVFNAIRLIRKNKIDVIYSSGPPWTCHLIGLIAKLFTGRKLVVDFRDPWESRPNVPSRLSVKIGDHLKNAVITKSDHVVTSTPLLTDKFKNNYHLSDDKCSTILNGFDEEDFVGRAKSTKMNNDPLNILYAGTLYTQRDPSSFFAAISELIEENFLRKEEIRIEFLGKNDFGENRTKNVLRIFGLEDITFSFDAVPKDIFYDKIIDADVLLLIQSGSSRNLIPGKTFEYLATGNTILALISEGATHNLLCEFDNVLIADIDDKEKIKDCIKIIVNERSISTNISPENKIKLQKLTRRGQTEKLVQILNKLI